MRGMLLWVGVLVVVLCLPWPFNAFGVLGWVFMVMGYLALRKVG